MRRWSGTECPIVRSYGRETFGKLGVRLGANRGYRLDNYGSGGNEMPAKVFIVDYASGADFKVCFVDTEGQQKNEQIIAGGKLVSSQGQANVKVFIVSSESQADICIMRKMLKSI